MQTSREKDDMDTEALADVTGKVLNAMQRKGSQVQELQRHLVANKLSAWQSGISHLAKLLCAWSVASWVTLMGYPACDTVVLSRIDVYLPGFLNQTIDYDGSIC